jgi:hypothetical protein
LLRAFLSDKITCVIKKLGLFFLIGLLIPPLEHSWSQEVTLDYDPALRATASRKSFERMSIEWPATPGSYYQIQSTPRLIGVSWTNFGNTLGPSTDRMTKEIHLESASETYFRVVCDHRGSGSGAILLSFRFQRRIQHATGWSLRDQCDLGEFLQSVGVDTVANQQTTYGRIASLNTDGAKPPSIFPGSDSIGRPMIPVSGYVYTTETINSIRIALGRVSEALSELS